MLLAFALSAIPTYSARATLRVRFTGHRARYKSTIAISSNFNMPPSQQTGHKSKVLVFGAGNFGSCLADHLGDSSHTVYMWSRSEKLVSHFNQYHHNPEALQDHVFVLSGLE